MPRPIYTPPQIPNQPSPGSTNGSGPASVEAAVGSEAASPPPAPASPPDPASPPPRSNVDKPAFVRADDNALDLGATVLPVILRSYAPQLAVAAVALVVGILIGRRSRR